MHPSVLYKVLCNHSPALSELAAFRVHRYADLMMKAMTPGIYKHKLAGNSHIPDEAIFIYSRYLEKRFGRKGFLKIDEIAKCFSKSRSYNRGKKLAYAYWLSAVGHELINEALDLAQNKEEYSLVNKDGKAIRHKSNGVYTARDNQGRNAKTNARLRFLVPINLDEITRVLDAGVSEVFPGIDTIKAQRITQQLRFLKVTANSCQFGHGNIPQVYKEVPSGRLCGIESLSLQNVMKKVRYIALSGTHEYDFENCHFCIMAHYAKEYGIEVPQITEYVNDTAGFRARIAGELEITPKQAKDCLLAVQYGATRSVRLANAIPNIIGPEKARMLYDDPRFELLCFEITEVGASMRKQARKGSKSAIINCLGKALLNRRGKPLLGHPRSELSHLLQGKESELLHLIISEYGDRIGIIQHDGFTLDEYVDLTEIEELVTKKTGMRMPITYQMLGLS